MLRTRIGASVIVNSSEMEQSINNNPRETSPEKTQQNLKTSLYAHHRISNTFTTRWLIIASDNSNFVCLFNFAVQVCYWLCKVIRRWCLTDKKSTSIPQLSRLRGYHLPWSSKRTSCDKPDPGWIKCSHAYPVTGWRRSQTRLRIMIVTGFVPIMPPDGRWRTH